MKKIIEFRKQNTLDLIKTQIVSNQVNTNQVILNGMLIFECQICKEQHSLYDFINHMTNDNHTRLTNSRMQITQSSFSETEAAAIMMQNRSFHDLEQIKEGIIFQCECGFRGVTPIEIHFHQIFKCQKSECSIHKVIENQFYSKEQPKTQQSIIPPQKTIDCQQQQEMDKPFVRWTADNDPGKAPNTIPYTPQAQLIVAPKVVEKQSQDKCKERITALTKNAKYLTDNTHNEFQFAIFQDMVKTIDVKRPIEGFNRILSQFRLRQCVKQIENEERGHINNKSGNTEQKPKKIPDDKEKKTWKLKTKPECIMVEDIHEIPDVKITFDDEEKLNQTKQKKRKRFDEKTLATVKELIAEFKYRKALELLDSFIKKDENKGNVKVDPSEREKQLQKLFPLPKQTELKLNFRPYQKQFFTFTEKEIFDAICELDTTKACGPCGISNKYIKDMRYNNHFIKSLKALFEELFNNPTKMSEILPLFEFKIALIPKEDKISKRPVCIQNSFCNVLNTVILKRKDLLPRQFCKEQHLFDKNSMQQCKLDARKLSKNSVVMKIDIQNAFNETQLETLLYGMETQLVPMQTQLYLCGLIQAQNCRETASYNLVQGNNLSSLCFSYAIQPILEELRKKYRISCYSDDIIIEIGQDTEKDVIQFATNLFSKYGFTINEKKCFSTANDNVITFDGINVSSTENDPRLHTSKKLIQTADEIYSLVEQLLERGLGRSQTLGIFLVSLIPKINWALRIEDYVEETIKDYNKIDEVMAQTFYMITNPRQFSEEDFMGEKRQVTIQNFINIMSAPLNRNGFNCILPGRNFKAAQKINAEQLQYKDLFIQLKEHNEQQNHATLITNMDSFAAQVLHKYHDLTNMEFQRAIDIMFDSDSLEPRNHAHICPLCQKHITDPNHAIFCSSEAGYAIKRHNKAQYDLVEHIWYRPSKQSGWSVEIVILLY
ncbi:RT/endonuclease [Hexamita inflata]|uniref:RT/endonuclease n=1 Tax=Hexamita inflata TaxID=28002 RepID=A0AA86TWZ6_9EUKA|nr:RT/endonuclease [Hexamita inflata]